MIKPIIKLETKKQPALLRALAPQVVTAPKSVSAVSVLKSTVVGTQVKPIVSAPKQTSAAFTTRKPGAAKTVPAPPRRIVTAKYVPPIAAAYLNKPTTATNAVLAAGTVAVKPLPMNVDAVLPAVPAAYVTAPAAALTGGGATLPGGGPAPLSYGKPPRPEITPETAIESETGAQKPTKHVPTWMLIAGAVGLYYLLK